MEIAFVGIALAIIVARLGWPLFIKPKILEYRRRSPNSKIITSDWWKYHFDRLGNDSYAQKVYEVVASKNYRGNLSLNKIPASRIAFYTIGDIHLIIGEKQQRHLKLSKVEQQIADLWLFLTMINCEGASYWFLDTTLEPEILKNVIQTYHDITEPAQASRIEKLLQLATEYHDAVAKKSADEKPSQRKLESQITQSEKYLNNTSVHETKILNYILQNASSFKI